jgi:acid phosphatase
MTNSFAIEHPSQPNYLDLFSGSNQGVTDNSGPYTFSAPNLGSGLLAAGRTFGGYSEDLPAVGYTGWADGDYVRRHNPWVNFTNVPAQANMPFAGYFPSDYSRLPNVSIVVPNLVNDMHDGTIAQGDAWLRSNLGGYAQWAQTHNSLFIVTWDEDDTSGNNQIPTIFVGAMVQPGRYGERIDHFSVLRTLEDMYGLAYVGASASAAPIADIWAASPPPPVLTAAASGTGRINLSWTESASNVTGFLVERSTDGSTFAQVAALGASATSYTDSGLTAGTRY